jgi:hypothetical protein
VGEMMSTPVPALTQRARSCVSTFKGRTAHQHKPIGLKKKTATGCTIAGHELGLGQQLDGRDEEGEGLTTAGPGSGENVVAAESVGNGECLDLGHPCHVHLLQRIARLVRQLQGPERVVRQDTLESCTNKVLFIPMLVI